METYIFKNLHNQLNDSFPFHSFYSPYLVSLQNHFPLSLYIYIYAFISELSFQANFYTFISYPNKNFFSKVVKMSFLQCSISVFLFLLFMIVGRTNGSSGNITPMAYLTVYVDPSGHGNFSTIQSAIDSVPSNNMKWICIYIKAGIYKYFFFKLLLYIFSKKYSIQLSYL